MSASPRRLFVWFLLGLAFASAATQGAGTAAQRPAPEAKASAAVQALLERAKKEAPEASLASLAEAGRQAGRDRPSLLAVVRAAHELGRTAYNERRDLATAKELFQRALAIWEKHTPGSLEVARGLDELGVIASDQGELAKARALLARSLALKEKRAPGSLEVARSLIVLGKVTRQGGELTKARVYCERALAIVEKQAPASPDMSAALQNLGGIASLQGDPAKAEQCYQRALIIREERAPGSLDVAASLSGLGIVALNRGDLAKAKEYHERAVAIQERRAPGSLVMASSLANLGIIVRQQGDLARAKENHERALAIREQQAPGSLAVANSLRNLAAVVRRQGDLAKGKEYCERALAIVEKHAPASLDMAAAMHSLGSVALEQGDLANAKAYHERALAIREKQAPGSLVMANSLANLGILAARQGDLAKATVYYERALVIRQTHAPTSLDMAISLNNQAALLDESGDAKGAEAHLRQALAIYEHRAPNSSDIPTILRNLARLQLEAREAGVKAEAAQHLKRAAALEEAVRSLPPETASGPQEGEERQARPEVRYLSPEQRASIQGSEVPVRVAFLAPLPLARYRVWINGRPFGPAGGFELPLVDEQARTGALQGGDRGRVLDREVFEKGRILDRNIMMEKGRILDRQGSREQLIGELASVSPPNDATIELAALLKQLQYVHYQQLKLTVPVEETDGEFLRNAIAVETTGGGMSERRILRLRRPEATRQRGPLRVLAIGISQYEKAPKLQFAAKDAVALGAALQTQGKGELLYSGADVTILTDSEATLVKIRAALARFTHDVQPGETLLLALSGHGVKSGSDFYFAPVGLDPEQMATTGLPWKEVLAALEGARQKAKAVWVLADCCRAAPGLRREIVATGADLKRGVEEGGNLVICTASSGDTPSYESEDLDHGLFTQAWLEALRGEAPEVVYQEVARGKVLTLSGLQFCVDASVIRQARKAGVRQQVEFPRLEGSFSPSMPVFVPAR